jgi:hypothetical protein
LDGSDLFAEDYQRGHRPQTVRFRLIAAWRPDLANHSFAPQAGTLRQNSQIPRGFFFVWILWALGGLGGFTLILSARGLYRFIWETPIVISPDDSRTIYTGGQMLLKSTDRGNHWAAISPDLSSHPSDKILPSSEGRLPGVIPWFAMSTISESPLAAGEIWAGRADAYVSRVRTSAHVAGRAYLIRVVTVSTILRPTCIEPATMAPLGFDFDRSIFSSKDEPENRQGDWRE